jgi:hypothetical protein
LLSSGDRHGWKESSGTRPGGLSCASHTDGYHSEAQAAKPPAAPVRLSVLRGQPQGGRGVTCPEDEASFRLHLARSHDLEGIAQESSNQTRNGHSAKVSLASEASQPLTTPWPLCRALNRSEAGFVSHIPGWWSSLAFLWPASCSTSVEMLPASWRRLGLGMEGKETPCSQAIVNPPPSPRPLAPAGCGVWFPQLQLALQQTPPSKGTREAPGPEAPVRGSLPSPSC